MAGLGQKSRYLPFYSIKRFKLLNNYERAFIRYVEGMKITIEFSCNHHKFSFRKDTLSFPLKFCVPLANPFSFSFHFTGIHLPEFWALYSFFFLISPMYFYPICRVLNVILICFYFTSLVVLESLEEDSQILLSKELQISLLFILGSILRRSRKPE